MGFRLWWSRGTGAWAPQLCLEEAGAAYERIPTDTRSGAHREAAYLAVNPLGQVPALALPDGTLMTESAAMVLHLADLFPEAGLMPPAGSPERAVALRWLLIGASALYPALLRYWYAERHTSDPAGVPGIKEAALAEVERLLGLVDGALQPGPWILGERFCATDYYLFMLGLWHPARQGVLERFPRLGRLMRAARARPAVERLWAQHYPIEGGHPWSTWTVSRAS
jgi:glutathione S-transferase/GST-like protein